ncbi:hypothetical protein IWW55_002898, partial [Coemansia sp. RSA 2706]
MHRSGFVQSLANSAIVLALLAGLANAHTLFVEFSAAGTDMGLNKCIRPFWQSGNSPVMDVTSADLKCRTSDMNWANTDVCPVAAGSTVTLRWNRNKSGSSDVISASHIGPCLVYMAAAESNGDGDAWFKIFESGVDSSSGQWCTTKLIANDGKLDVVIPSDLKPGNYLLRPELIALHGARREGQCQFFPNCAQLQITGSGSAQPAGVALPGYYKATDPGILYAKKSDNSGYVIPGPPVYQPGSGSTSTSSNTTLPVGSSSPAVQASSTSQPVQ